MQALNITAGELFGGKNPHGQSASYDFSLSDLWVTALDIFENEVEEYLQTQHSPNEPEKKEAPIDETPIDETPIDEAPIDEAPIDEEPIDEEPIDDAPIDDAPIDEAHASIDDVSIDDASVEQDAAAGACGSEMSDDEDIESIDVGERDGKGRTTTEVITAAAAPTTKTSVFSITITERSYEVSGTAHGCTGLDVMSGESSGCAPRALQY